ncbi:MAG: UbiD family decarboxylase [Betaproteobacteria bacterium]|nr:UbiD family decarboxylase [Betaproteobacteria bacterium]MBI2959958.1 UbiD family decarboxylase [Betaproteobacteria bacterium]
MANHLENIRHTLKWLEDRDELITIDREIDPRFEISGLAKELDNGPPLLFRNLKGHPGKCVTAGLFSRLDRLAAMFGASDAGIGLKRRGIDAARNPVPARAVANAPCQEIVRLGPIDVRDEIPITTHTMTDPGPILSGGVVLLRGPGSATDVSFKRIRFQGPDWASMFHVPGTHSAQILEHYAARKLRLPLTINISPPPAVLVVAAGGLIQDLLPFESDELGVAGALGGAPVAICPARTVDAYAIAESEWVIEGYVDTAQLVAESAAAASPDPAPFFPEYHGYLGRAQTTYRFQATAVTRRGENPINYAPLAHSFESPNMQVITNRALQLAWLWERWPELVRDINSLPGMKGRFGMVVQVRKGGEADDPAVRELIRAVFERLGALRMVVAVDDDVDIYDSDEVLWALATRMNAERDMVQLPPAGGPAGIRKETAGPFAAVARLGFDATMPFSHRREFDRGQYPRVEPERWLSPSQIARVRSMQSDYARLLSSIKA